MPKAGLTSGLIRLVLAAVIAALLGVGWAAIGTGGAFLAVALAVALAAGVGVLSMLEKPGVLLRQGLLLLIVDSLAVALLVGGTGGEGSPFLPLYFLAALGVARVADTARAVAGSAVLVAGYLTACFSADGLGVLDEPGAILSAGLIMVFCGVVGFMGAESRGVEQDRRDLSAALEEGRDHQAKTAKLASEIGPLLANLSLEGILQWTAEVARGLTGASYVHVAVLEGNHHRTVVGNGDRDVYPSWWHPTIQRLALWSCREDEVLRSEEDVRGLEGFLAVPVSSPGGERWGAVILGGGARGAEEEHVLKLVAARAATALEKAVGNPGGRDPVSGLPGRSSLHRVLDKELSYGRALTVLMADLDRFRRYNEAYGLAAGDALLREVGRTLEENQQPAFRYGGDEIVVVLKGPGRTRARRVAAGIQRMVEELTADSLAPLTASVGFAVTSSEDADPDVVLDAAARALNKAKSQPAGSVAEADDRVAAGPGAAGSPGVGTRVPEAALALVEAAEVRIPHIGAHLRAVSLLARRLGAVMSLPREETDALTVGALLHDVGKIGIPDSVLLKVGSLSAEEYETIKSHPVLGASILATIGDLSPALPAVKHHHERFDGGGYPDGLRGEEIPIIARIVFVADAFDSMVRGRPYRHRLPAEAALEEISLNSGTQFDPSVVAALREVVEESGGRVAGLAN